MREYFELEDDLGVPRRWYLNGISDSKGARFDPRYFRYGLRVELGPPLKASLFNEHTVVEVAPPLTVALGRDGEPLDFTFAAFGVPVVTARIGGLLSALDSEGIQRIPVNVESHGSNYEIVNVASRVACIEPERSNITWWTEGNGGPDKAGKPRMIIDLAINPELTCGRYLSTRGLGSDNRRLGSRQACF